ncbi:unnamed protein product [Prunus armeniaca]
MAPIHGLKSIGMLLILIIFLCFSTSMGSSQSFERLTLPANTTSPVSLAFDKDDEGPYVITSDGLVVKHAPNIGFLKMATFKFQRGNKTKQGLTDACERPRGMAFNNLGNKIYFADAYDGLFVVRFNSLKKREVPRLAIHLATSVKGVPLGFLSGLDVDPKTGMLYLTDATSVYGLRIQKYWLKGPKANIAETIYFGHRVAHPIHIRRTKSGQFWVATNPNLFKNVTVPTAVLIDSSGSFVLKKVSLDDQYNQSSVSEVQEALGTRYVGSFGVNYIGAFNM